MANLKVLNGDGAAKYIKSSGAGTDVDPHANSVVVDSIAAGNNNIGDVDVASIAAGTNLIGKVSIDQVTANANEVVVKSGTVTAVTGITNALPAGTNAIGKLASNTGVDIGDVDVTSIVPGTAATNLGKAEDAVHSSGDVGVMALAVRKDTVGALAADGDYAPILQNANGEIMVSTRPLSAMLEGGLTELVGINEQVDQNDYSEDIGVALGGTYSGEILSVALYATEDGTGAVQDSAGILYVFDADPTIASGDTAMSAAARVTVIGKIAVAAADWDTDANGGLAYVSNVVIPFHALANLYFVWKHLDATALNDAAGDDEQLEFNFWYRRES